MQSTNQTIGAQAVIVWNDTNQQSNVYFSFGEYNEDTGEDTHGVDDDSIFFYAENGEAELDQLMHPSTNEDFTILSYELVSRA